MVRIANAEDRAETIRQGMGVVMSKKKPLSDGDINTAKNTYHAIIYSSAGASASSFSAGLSASCISEVQRVRLSRRSCMIRVESL